MNKDIISVKPHELVELVRAETEKGESVRITVVGSSMYPFLRSGIDSAGLFPIDNIKKNDVLFYLRKDGQCVLHRCIDIKGDEYIMCGDNQTEREYGIKRSNIIAAAKVFYRGGREITPDTPWYRLYMFLWCTLFPLRPMMCVLLKGVMKIRRIFKRSR